MNVREATAQAYQNGYDKGYAEGMAAGRKETVGWRDAKHDPPEDQRDVLIFCFWRETWQTMIGWRNRYTNQWWAITPDGDGRVDNVKLWSELPEPEEVNNG